MKKKNYYTRLFSECRRCWSMSNESRKNALLKVKTKDSEGLEKYECAICKKNYARSDIQVDHVEAIGKQPTCINSLITAIKALHSDNLQILCSKCHKIKTKCDVADIKKTSYKNQINYFLDNLGYAQISQKCYEKMTLADIKKLRDLVDKVRSNDKNKQKNENKLLKILNKI